MKLLQATCALLILSGCTTIPTQHGTAQFWGDYTKIAFDDGSVHFRADTAIHSTAVRGHWHGINNFAATAVTGAIGLHGANQVASAIPAVIPAIVNRPTTRATPTP